MTKQIEMKHFPPKLFLRFFRWFCHPKMQDYIEGDLMEVYEKRLNEFGKRKADIKFIVDVLLLFRPSIIKPAEGYKNLNTYGMYRNYAKITTRNLLKHKLYSFINIGGLAVGLASFILVFLYVQHEFSYDGFYKNANQIYRVYQKQEGNVFLGTEFFAVTPVQLATAMRNEFPEVASATSIEEQSALLGFNGQSFYEKGLAGDSEFFQVFSIPFLQGDSKTALRHLKSIILTKSLASKIFGDNEIIGKQLKFQNGEDYTVTGVINDAPSNSSFEYSYIINIESITWYAAQLARTKWNNNSMHTFFVLAEGVNPNQLQQKLPALFKKYQDPQEYSAYPFKDQYFIQPISEIHLQSHLNFDIGVKGNSKYIYLFSIIAIIILLVACVNYMNLAVARSINRAREVGLRKVVGALRSQLIMQFLGESVLITILALGFALVLVQLSLPVFGQLIERTIELNFFEHEFFIPTLLVVVIFIGILSGSYPALIMSSLRPINVLKGKVLGRLSGFRLQHWLIVTQYVASISLIVCSVVIYHQLQYMQQKELGYTKENIIVIQARDQSLFQNYEAIRNEWLQQPRILEATTSSQLPVNITASSVLNLTSEGTDQKLAIYVARADYEFLSVFGITLTSGRNFSREIMSDKEEGCIINETAARTLGWTANEATGKQFSTSDGTRTIIGVIKDFHMHSMHLPIHPLMITLQHNYGGFISVKVKPQDLSKTLALLETSIKKYSAYPMEYQFLDDHFNQLYKSDMKLGEIFGFFTIISILIASLGLFGLAAFTSGQRTKEIGIRKVLGASAKSIVVLVSKDFLGLILIAFLISIPFAWYAMHIWLQDFAYRIEMEWWMFAGAGFGALLIAKISIAYQSLKASLTNPVDSLKSE